MSESTEHYPPSIKIRFKRETMSSNEEYAVEAHTARQAWNLYLKLRKESNSLSNTTP